MLSSFECRVKYAKIDEHTGKERKATELYLVDALSYTEAEKRINEEMEAMIAKGFLVKNIRPANYSDVISDDGENWFKARVAFIQIDDKGKESKSCQNMLVLADNMDEVSEKIADILRNVTIPFEITSITKSKIVDVFFRNEEKISSIDREEEIVQEDEEKEEEEND